MYIIVIMLLMNKALYLFLKNNLFVIIEAYINLFRTVSLLERQAAYTPSGPCLSWRDKSGNPHRTVSLQERHGLARDFPERQEQLAGQPEKARGPDWQGPNRTVIYYVSLKESRSSRQLLLYLRFISRLIHIKWSKFQPYCIWLSWQTFYIHFIVL